MDTAKATFGNANDGAQADQDKCLRMSGLPFRATEQEMKDFFLPETKCLSVKVVFL